MRKFCYTCGVEYTVASVGQLYCSDLCRQAQTSVKTPSPIPLAPAKAKRRAHYFEPEPEEEFAEISEESLLTSLKKNTRSNVAPVQGEELKSVMGSSPDANYKKYTRKPVTQEYFDNITKKSEFVIDND